MKRLTFLRIGFAVLLGSCLGLTGCAKAPSGPPVTAPTPVSVSVPLEREVTDYADYTGRTAAVESVEVRARVWGYLDKVNFKEGAMVKAGDALYEIDPRTYRAALEQAEAKVALDEATSKFNEADYQRISDAAKNGSVTKQEIEKAVAARDTAAAAVKADKADLEQRRLDLSFTSVKAPISGRVSRTLVTVGNLVQGGQSGGTLLTTIVSVDPMYAFADVDERTVLQVQRLIRAGKAISARTGEVSITLGLAIEEGFPHAGTINFVDNQVNPKTGTLRVRGVFANGDQYLTPGLFVRVRIPIGKPHPALLISDRALDTDQGQKIVYIVTEKNEVVARPVRIGALHDGLRAVDDGLKAGERVIVNGLQQVRPGAIVEPKLVDMPGQKVSGGVVKGER